MALRMRETRALGRMLVLGAAAMLVAVLGCIPVSGGKVIDAGDAGDAVEMVRDVAADAPADVSSDGGDVAEPDDADAGADTADTGIDAQRTDAGADIGVDTSDTETDTSTPCTGPEGIWGVVNWDQACWAP